MCLPLPPAPTLQTTGPPPSRSGDRASVSSHVPTVLVVWTIASVVLATLLVQPPALAQTDPDSSRTRPAGDPTEVIGDLDPESGSEELARRLIDLAGDPMDLNRASDGELADLPFLTPVLARRVVDVRGERGPFRSVDDLLDVPGVDAALLDRIRPFVYVNHSRPSTERRGDSATPARRVRLDITQQLSRRLDLGRGYSGDTTRTTYLGSPERLVTRIRGRVGRHVRFGLTLDKDPGEPVEWNPGTGMYGADHVSATASIDDVGRLNTVVVGDFAVAYGQGVAFWRSTAFGKGRAPIRPLLRSGRGLRPWSTADENTFFRGVGTSVNLLPSVDLSAWVSRKRRDASSGAPLLRADGRTEVPVSSLASSGYHRTPSERSRKNAVQETHAGAALTLERRRWELGFAAGETAYHRPLQPEPVPERRFEPRGSTFRTTTVFGAAYPGDVHLFGEIARSTGSAWGGIMGLSTTRRRTSALLFGRWYPPDFWSIHGQTLGEQSGRPRNERGVYLGVRSHVAPRWTVAAYTDVYTFPWLRFRIPRPSSGIDVRAVIEHRPHPWLTHSVEIRSETQGIGVDRSLPTGTLIEGIGRQTRETVRWNGTFDFSNRLRLRTRLDVVRVQSSAKTTGSPTSESGVLLYQGLRWQPTDRVTTETRLAFFDTDGFASRVFAYEYDVRGAFSIPALQGRGERFYALLRAKPSRRWVIEAKYAVTSVRGVSSLGSGLDETPGSRVREVRLQVRLRLGS